MRSLYEKSNANVCIALIKNQTYSPYPFPPRGEDVNSPTIISGKKIKAALRAAFFAPNPPRGEGVNS